MTKTIVMASVLWLASCLACSSNCLAQAKVESARASDAKVSDARASDGKASAAVGEATLKTWAILSDKSAMDSGVTDALLAELSATDMRMVEREQLKQAVDEQALQTLMGGLSEESRRLGKILNADALILVTHAPRPVALANNPNAINRQAESAPDSSKIMRLIICECKHGLRLGELNIELKPVDEQVRLLVDYIQDRRQQFAQGIKIIVGLAPIACRNIERDFDHLRQRYFDMLTGRLMTVPGLALLEIAEARRIASEPGSGDQVAERLVPVMVECEYRVQVRQDVRQVRFKAELSGSAIETFESSELALERSGEWLGQELVDQVLSRGQGKPLELAKQQALLAQRADYLMHLGDLAAAVQCREAFLLADPTNVPQRRAVIENLLVVGNQVALRSNGNYVSVRERTAKMVEMAASWTPVTLDHLVYLIESSEVDQAVAIDLMDRMQTIRFLQGPLVHVVQTLKQHEEVRASLNSLLSANRRFVLHTAAKVLDLPASADRTPEIKARQLATWHQCVMRMVADDIALNAGSVESFRYLEQVVLNRVPEELPTSWEILNAITTYRRSFSALRITNQDYTFETVDIQVDESAIQAWLQRLITSPHLHLRWYARTNKLLSALPPGEDLLPVEMQHELNLLVAELRQRPLSELRWNSGALMEPLLERLQYIQRNRAQHEPIAGIAPTTRQLPMSDVIGGNILVQKIEVKFPEKCERIQDFIKTDQGIDIVVCDRAVGVLKGKSTFTTIHETQPYKSSTVWDGEHLWIAETDKGITRFDIYGQHAGRITEKDGLPRHDVDLQVLAVQKNQVLVYGATGPDGRCWLALLSIVKGEPQIKVIHEARQPYRPVINSKDPSLPLSNDDPTMGFKLMWWNVVSVGSRRVCFVGRQTSPLAIDLQTEKVSVVRLEPGAANAWGNMIAGGGYLYKPYTTGVAQYQLPTDQLQPRLSRVVVDAWLPNTAPLWADYPPRLTEHDGWLYKPGKVWYRFRVDGNSVQRLNSPESPKYHLFNVAATSNHFGIVAWSAEGATAELYKITPPK